MTAKSLPALPSLEQLRQQAKELVKLVAASDPEAIRRTRAHLPRLVSSDPTDLSLKLSDAQLVLARELGFASWPRLKSHIEESAAGREAAVASFKRAVEARDSARVRALLRSSQAVRDATNEPLFSFDSPAVVCAASRSDRKTLDVLLEYGADVNARSKWWAGGFGVLPHPEPEFAEYLISRGAVVDVWAAAGLGRTGQLAAILAADPTQVNARGGDGQGPLHFAADVPTAQCLLDHGAEIDMRDIDHESTPAQWMVVDRPQVCRFLVERGAETDIFMAVQLGDLALVQRVLDADPDSLRAHVNAGKLTSGTSSGGHIYTYTLRNRMSPIFLAADLGHTDICSLLLERCTPVEKLLAACMNADGPSARAVLAEQPELIRNLTAEQKAILPGAAWGNRPAAVRLMLELGFDTEAVGDEASTALNRAAVRGYVEIIEALLAKGASLDARNAYGGDALGACIWGAENFRDPAGDYPAAVKRLLAAGASAASARFPTTNRAVNAVLKAARDSSEVGAAN